LIQSSFLESNVIQCNFKHVFVDAIFQVKDNERKTKLAYVDGVAKAPRNFQRAQDKNGTGAVVSTQAMRKLTGPPPLPKSAREVGSSGGGGGGASAGPPAASKKPKVAPMMAKTLKMVRGLKVNFRR
jgi:hypothetical protein